MARSMRLPTAADLIALAGPSAFAVARARLHAAMATDDFVEAEHYSALCRALVAAGEAEPFRRSGHSRDG